MVDTVEIPLLSERQLAGLKTGNRENIAFDELGNAVWQFSPHDAVDIDSSQSSTRNLEHPSISIVDDDPLDSAPLRTNVKGLRAGYNPYDSGQLAGKVSRKPRDLRELSKWIEKGLRAGYNPYDSGQLAGKVSRKPRDLRELSKWIELRNKLDAGK